ncbi:MAG: hypothetical protein QW594_03505 [Candidatus Woesearchaeota archaeon]
MATFNAINNTALPQIHWTGFSLAEFFTETQGLAWYVLGIFLYGLFVFKFYKFLARRDILTLKLQDYTKEKKGAFKRFIKICIYILENIIVIPLLVFFWFLVLALALLFLGKTHTAQSLLITAMAIVASVRIAAYYHEELALELAKLIPLGLLAVFLVDNAYFSMDHIMQTAEGIPMLWKSFLYYFLLVILLELLLRLGRSIGKLFRKAKES